MNDDFSNIVSNFSKILEDKNIDLSSILNSSNTKNDDCSSTNSSKPVDNSSKNFNFEGLDINTLFKIKNIMSKLNSQNDSRSNLLLSLKPYLRESKKKKVDQYIQILKLLSVLETIDFEGGKFNDLS